MWNYLGTNPCEVLGDQALPAVTLSLSQAGTAPQQGGVVLQVHGKATILWRPAPDSEEPAPATTGCNITRKEAQRPALGRAALRGGDRTLCSFAGHPGRGAVTPCSPRPLVWSPALTHRVWI